MSPSCPQFPLFCLPQLVERPWGGDALADWGKPVEKGQRIGESWEIVDLPGRSTCFEDGEFPDLGALIAGRHLGAVHEFPLLVKFIDAQENLSIQLHPKADTPDGRAKTEAWLVLEAPEGAFLYAGLREARPAAELVERIARGDLSALDRIQVQKGDVVFVPGGTPHALTTGLLIAEVQQSSDTTWRMWDWNRRDASGKGRDLHLAQAVRDMEPHPHLGLKVPPLRLEEGREILCASPHFVMARRTGRFRVEARDHLRILVQLGNGGVLRTSRGERPFARGRTCLFPPGTSAELEGGEVLESWVPDLSRDVTEPLLRAGHSRLSIRALGAWSW